METRKVSDHICLAEVPFVMRAIGFYPSEEKVGGGGGCRALSVQRPLGAAEVGVEIEQFFT